MNEFISRIGRKFQNYVFRHGLGKSIWSARVISKFFEFFEKYEQYSNTGNVSSFDHYVPQLILNRFRLSEKGKDKGNIGEFNFKTAKFEHKPIGKIAGEIGFDSFRDKFGQQSDYVSKKLYSELLELRGSKIIKKLNTSVDEPNLSYLEESTLAVFLSYQLTRVPAFLDSLELFILYLYENSILSIEELSDMTKIDSVIVKNSFGITAEQLLNFNPQNNLKGTKDRLKFISRLIAQEISEKVFRSNLHLLLIPKNTADKFVISDNPVVLLDMSRGEILKYPVWWEIDKKELIIFMPISPNKTIFYIKRLRHGSVIEDQDSGLVDAVNFGQFINARESVFSHHLNILQKYLRKYGKDLVKDRIR